MIVQLLRIVLALAVIATFSEMAVRCGGPTGAELEFQSPVQQVAHER